MAETLAGPAIFEAAVVIIAFTVNVLTALVPQPFDADTFIFPVVVKVDGTDIVTFAVPDPVAIENPEGKDQLKDTARATGATL